MGRSCFKFLLSFLFLPQVFTYPHIAPITKPGVDFTEADVFLKRTIVTLDKLIWFLENHYEEGNLDLFLGTRIAQGQLSTLLDQLHAKESGISRELQTRLELMLNQLEFISEHGATLVKGAEGEYYARIGGVLRKGIWDIDYSEFRKVNTSLITHNHGKESIQERQSDDCIHSFLPKTNSLSEKCIVSESCWEMMTASGFYGYSLTHQLFLLEIAARVGCKENLILHASISNRSLSELADQMCANIYGQAIEIAENQFPPTRHDLFIEQTALCGILGYSSFFKSPWLEKILLWQRSNGCYGDLNKYPHVDHYAADHQKTDLQSAVSAITTRTKRQERKMSDGCSAHRTAVAAAALAAYTKFLVLTSTGTI